MGVTAGGCAGGGCAATRGGACRHKESAPWGQLYKHAATTLPCSLPRWPQFCNIKCRYRWGAAPLGSGDVGWAAGRRPPACEYMPRSIRWCRQACPHTPARPHINRPISSPPPHPTHPTHSHYGTLPTRPQRPVPRLHGHCGHGACAEDARRRAPSGGRQAP